MLKNIKAKIMLAFAFLSILTIALFGLLFINRLGDVSQKIANPNIGPNEIKGIVDQEVQNTQKCIIIASGVAIGGGAHNIHSVSTSPIFNKGHNIFGKNSVSSNNLNLLFHNKSLS